MTTTGSRPTPAVRADRANGVAPRPPAGLPDVAELAHRIGANVQHVLVGKPDVVRIAPSLVISLDEILEGLARLEAALNRALT